MIVKNGVRGLVSGLTTPPAESTLLQTLLVPNLFLHSLSMRRTLQATLARTALLADCSYTVILAEELLRIALATLLILGAHSRATGLAAMLSTPLWVPLAWLPKVQEALKLLTRKERTLSCRQSSKRCGSCSWGLAKHQNHSVVCGKHRTPGLLLARPNGSGYKLVRPLQWC